MGRVAASGSSESKSSQRCLRLETRKAVRRRWVFGLAATVLGQLAANPKTQRLLTAFLVSKRKQRWLDFDSEDPDAATRPIQKSDPAIRWLEAVEAAGASD